MRWIRFSTEGRTAYGVVNGSTVNEISGEPWGVHQLVGKTYVITDVTPEVPVIPRDATEKISYEGELVVVIGKQAKHLGKANAMSCVFGYTIGNGGSERTWQRGDRTIWRGKNADTLKPMGPWIQTDVDLDAMQTTVRSPDLKHGDVVEVEITGIGVLRNRFVRDA